MNIVLHIDRLVLDGLDVGGREGVLLQDAMQMELTRLLTQHGIGDPWHQGGAVPRLAAPSLTLNEQESPRSWGQAIGRSVYQSMSGVLTTP